MMALVLPPRMEEGRAGECIACVFYELVPTNWYESVMYQLVDTNSYVLLGMSSITLLDLSILLVGQTSSG